MKGSRSTDDIVDAIEDLDLFSLNHGPCENGVVGGSSPFPMPASVPQRQNAVLTTASQHPSTPSSTRFQTPRTFTQRQLVCWKCNRPGHRAVDCRTGTPPVMCSSCGRTGHDASRCRTPKCTFCNKLGHTESMCFSKQRQQREQSAPQPWRDRLRPRTDGAVPGKRNAALIAEEAAQSGFRLVPLPDIASDSAAGSSSTLPPNGNVIPTRA